MVCREREGERERESKEWSKRETRKESKIRFAICTSSSIHLNIEKVPKFINYYYKNT